MNQERIDHSDELLFQEYWNKSVDNRDYILNSVVSFAWNYHSVLIGFELILCKAFYVF